MNRFGFSLIELLMTLLILGIISVISIEYMATNIDEIRFNATRDEMLKIKRAMLGDENILVTGVRSDFGFQGDIGALPTSLNQLTVRGALPLWSLNTTNRIGLGWNGPYFKEESGTDSYLTDAWGRNYVYNGATNPATLTSYGLNGVVGGVGLNSDIIVSIPQTSHRANVYGFVTQDGSPYSSTATVELFQPNGSGALQTQTFNMIAGNNGAFTFTNVPFGQRAITVYIPSKAAATSTIGPVQVTIDSTNISLPSDYFSFSMTCTNYSYMALSATPSISFSTTTNTNDTINFNYNVTTAVILRAITATWVNGRMLRSVSLNGAARVYTSYGSTNTIDPRYPKSGTKSTFSAVYNHPVVNNVQAKLQFNDNLTNITPTQAGKNISVVFHYVNGCSLIEFTMP